MRFKLYLFIIFLALFLSLKNRMCYKHNKENIMRTNTVCQTFLSKGYMYLWECVDMRCGGKREGKGGEERYFLP